MSPARPDVPEILRLASGERPSPSIETGLLRLIESCFPECGGEGLSLEPQRWVVLLDQVVAAQAALLPTPLAVAEGPPLHLAHLAYVATLPALRGRGLASLLLKHLQQEAPALGYAGLVLHAAPQAQALYSRCGWERVAPRAWYAEEGRHDPDPVMLWSPDATMARRLYRDCWTFPRDW